MEPKAEYHSISNGLSVSILSKPILASHWYKYRGSSRSALYTRRLYALPQRTILDRLSSFRSKPFTILILLSFISPPLGFFLRLEFVSRSSDCEAESDLVNHTIRMSLPPWPRLGCVLSRQTSLTLVLSLVRRFPRSPGTSVFRKLVPDMLSPVATPLG